MLMVCSADMLNELLSAKTHWEISSKQKYISTHLHHLQSFKEF